VQRAFGDKDLPLGTPTGIAPNQPDAWKAASAVISLAFMALIVLGIVFSMAAKDELKLHQQVSLGGGSGSPAAAAIGLPVPSVGGVAALVDPRTVPECAEYEAVYTASTACAKAPAETREAFKTVFDATFVASDRDILAASCKTGVEMMHQALDEQCTLPTHDQYLATLAAGSGSAEPAPIGPEITTAPPDSVFFSDPIQIDGGRNIQIEFRANNLSNDWVYIAADLVEHSTGGVISDEANMEYYSGYDDGDSWSEGTRESSTTFGPQPAGTYVLRLEAQHGSPGLMPIDVTIKQGVFRGKWLGWAMLCLGVPLLFIGLISYFHEKKRWENSNSGKAPVTPVSILILAFIGVFIAIAFIFKAMREAGSND
jgi:hypothetical protein